MTLIQEAYSLMQNQPENNIRIIVDLLRVMNQGIFERNVTQQPFRRTGIANGVFNLPDDFDEQFDAMDEEIAELFYGSEA